MSHFATISLVILVIIVILILVWYFNKPAAPIPFLYNVREKKKDCSILPECGCGNENKNSPDKGNEMSSYSSFEPELNKIKSPVGTYILPECEQSKMPGPGAPFSIGIASLLMNKMSDSTIRERNNNAKREKEDSCFVPDMSNSSNPSVVDMEGTPYSTISGEPIMFRDATSLYTNTPEIKTNMANNFGLSVNAMNIVNNAREQLLTNEEWVGNNPTEISSSSTSDNSLLQRAYKLDNPNSCSPNSDTLSLMNALVAPSYADISRESNILSRETNLSGGSKICGRMKGGTNKAKQKYSMMADDTAAINYMINMKNPELQARYIDILNNSGKMGMDEDAMFKKPKKEYDFLMGDLNLPIPAGQNKDDYLNTGIFTTC